MKSWEHCAMVWCMIDVSLAIKDIKDKDIVKCVLNNKEYFFNIPDDYSLDITPDMINNGKWYVYTWAL